MSSTASSCRAPLNERFRRVASCTATAMGSSSAFFMALSVVLVWAVTGPLFNFSDTWQLVINTGTTIVTFLMVFLIQNSQNRDGLALQTKLDELIRASDAENEFIGIEKLTDKELDALHERCMTAAEKTQRRLDRAKAERE